jgi:colanic acid biosynthesis protein WcaH
LYFDECLGTAEHVYDTAETDGVDSKHYLATGHRCHFERDDPELGADEQHSAIRIFYPPFEGLHQYVQRYLDDW